MKKLIKISLFSLIVLSIFVVLKAEQLFIKIDDNVVIGNDVNMTLYLDNIEYDTFTFRLLSSESLENINTNDIDLTNLNNEEITFDYCINCSSLKTIILKYKLPSNIEVGDSITFYAQIINKEDTTQVKSYRKVVNIIDNVIVNEETNSTNTRKSFNNRIKLSNTPSMSGNNKSPVSTKYKGSSNNYLSDLKVTGYELNKEFIKERLTYFVNVPSDVKSINIKATKEDKNSSINITGNNNLEVGLNKVLVSVISEDGRIKNYRIYVTRLGSDNNE